MTQKKNYLLLCILASLGLCVAQISGNPILILGCLAAFLAILFWCCCNDFTLPILLYFLPWATLLKQAPGAYSFYTIGLIIVCLVSVIKKRFSFKRYHLVASILLLILTLFSKLLDNSFLTVNYIAFFMMLALFPVVKEENTKQQYDFVQVVIFFSLGIIIAAVTAQLFDKYPNISRYIRVDAYANIVRRCGYYSDANFYTAQITAAVGGVLFLTLTDLKKKTLSFLLMVLIFLLYCGFLSGSKSFVLVAATVILAWLIAFLRMRGKVGLKLVILICAVTASVYIATSVLFSGLIKVLVVRFGHTRDLNSFTTGRLDIWKWYFKEIVGNTKVFFLGKGFTDVKVNGRAPHNTILQVLFQFGILGVPILLYWMISFFRDIYGRTRKRKGLDLWVVIIGVAMPWMAIDGLFFDDFFLLQWYLFVAMIHESSPPRSGSKSGERHIAFDVPKR